ncbi:hypothetical protein F5I97DRAFT_1829428 [Phlebopus sp. FC_14]|nr:hypothetical protein F5I97DRAFT_1829428 [Phlebopus sp. FC_14]
MPASVRPPAQRLATKTQHAGKVYGALSPRLYHSHRGWSSSGRQLLRALPATLLHSLPNRAVILWRFLQTAKMACTDLRVLSRKLAEHPLVVRRTGGMTVRLRAHAPLAQVFMECHIVRVESSTSFHTRAAVPTASTELVHSDEAVFVFREPRFIPIDPSHADYTIKECLIEYPNSEGNLPPGWTAHVHPEGALYYMHGEMACFHSQAYSRFPDLATEDVHGSKHLTLYGELRQAIVDGRVNLNLEDVELVLEPRADDHGVLCSYYFAHRRKRCLFWLEDFDARSMLGDCKGVAALSHKRLAVEAQYWKHRDLFPVLGEVTRELATEVKSMLLHATCDHLSSTRSTAALSTGELMNYLAVVDKIENRNQYLNFHGQPCARLSVDQTVHGWRYRPSTAMIILAPLLCMAPIAHVRSLHMSFVDDIASTVEWNTFITKLNGQLQNLNLLGTVLLGANVGFLAIQSVDEGGGRSVTQIASYTSLVFSFGSIALGLTFIGLNLTGHERGSEAANFLRRMSDERHGLEKLAIIYSLPFAFLMWSMLLFLLAFSVEWCKPGDKVSRATVASVLLVVCGLIVWCIHVAQDRRARWWWKADPRVVPRAREKRPPLAQRLITRLRSWKSPTPSRAFPPTHSLTDAPRATGATSTTVDLTIPVVTLQKPGNDITNISLSSSTSARRN